MVPCGMPHLKYCCDGVAIVFILHDKRKPTSYVNLLSL